MSSETDANPNELLRELLEVQKQLLSTQERIEVLIERIAKVAPFVLIAIAGLMVVVAGTS
jgi:hypothetical protein